MKNAMNWVPDSSPKQQIKPIQNMQNQEAIQRVSPRDAEPKPNQDKENDKIKLEKGLRSLTATFGAFTGAALMADYGGRFGGGKGFAAGAVIGLLGGHVAGDQLGWGLAKVGEGAAKTHEWLKSNKNHTRSIFDLW